MKTSFTVAILVACCAVPARPLSAQKIPTADAILARHEAALGGRAALDKHTTMRLTGRVEISAADISGKIEILRGKPKRYVQKMTLNRVGELLKGFDGSVAWALDPSGPGLMTDVDDEIMRVEADWYHDFIVVQAVRGARVDSADFEGEPAWQLTYASSLGLEVRAYFNRRTGLRIGESWVSGIGETTVLEGEYKTFGGVTIPTRIVNRATIGEMVITIENVEFDKLASDAFDPPPSVKAIIRKH